MPRHVSLLYCALLAVVLGACGRTPPAPAANTGAVAEPLPTSSLVQIGGAPGAAPTPAPDPTVPAATPGPATVVVNVDAPGIPLDRRVLGTNLPAWIRPELLSDPAFQALTVNSGATVLRLPGGTWSNHYDWLGCETGDEELCYWPWAARPTDFINFLRATGLEGMWTVSFNGTAKEAAALVAFFNGKVDDDTEIGVDQRGRDWKTVGHWAQLRAKQGNPEPLPIKLWEVGNEVYGAKQDSGGPGCSEWGWEEVWTCDAKEYVEGKGEDAERRDGFLDFREEMLNVDPEILVGAVGVEKPAEWSSWGDTVIESAGRNMDFYVVHHYPYGEAPAAPETIMAESGDPWVRIMRNLELAFQDLGAEADTPVAVTEYNLIAFQDSDSQQLMRRAVNALYVADTIGQMASQGVRIANVWNLANGRPENGTDYGLIEPDSGQRNPSYYALALWSRMGDSLLPVKAPAELDNTLRVYATRGKDGEIGLLVINKTAGPISSALQLGGSDSYTGKADALVADGLLAEDVSFNGDADPATDLSTIPPEDLGVLDSTFTYDFPATSITFIRLTPRS